MSNGPFSQAGQLWFGLRGLGWGDTYASHGEQLTVGRLLCVFPEQPIGWEEGEAWRL